MNQYTVVPVIPFYYINVSEYQQASVPEYQSSVSASPSTASSTATITYTSNPVNAATAGTNVTNPYNYNCNNNNTGMDPGMSASISYPSTMMVSSPITTLTAGINNPTLTNMSTVPVNINVANTTSLTKSLNISQYKANTSIPTAPIGGMSSRFANVANMNNYKVNNNLNNNITHSHSFTQTQRQTQNQNQIQTVSPTSGLINSLSVGTSAMISDSNESNINSNLNSNSNSNWVLRLEDKNNCMNKNNYNINQHDQTQTHQASTFGGGCHGNSRVYTSSVIRQATQARPQFAKQFATEYENDKHGVKVKSERLGNGDEHSVSVHHLWACNEWTSGQEKCTIGSDTININSFFVDFHPQKLTIIEPNSFETLLLLAKIQTSKQNSSNIHFDYNNNGKDIDDNYTHYDQLNIFFACFSGICRMLLDFA